MKTTKENKEKQRCKVVCRQTNDGWIAEVPVTDKENRPKVTISLPTWNKLLVEGLYPILSVHRDGYVTAWSPYRRMWKRLARLIANANSEQQVSLRDGNELNLLESNIILINPNKKPITYDRTEFLTTEIGPFLNMVDTEWDFGPKPDVAVFYTPQNKYE
jgi:hypothetical protein